MTKKLWISALLIITVLISGCIFDNGNNQNSTSGIIPQTALPVGFTYMGTHETPVDIGGTSINATEGVYRYNNLEDVYVQVIKNDNPETLIGLYKSSYKNVKYNPFIEISLNGHKATQVTDYSTINGNNTPNYSVIWTNDSSMIIVGSSPDASAILSLATATGH
jgi:PBP1b-binding outer membrane lipoprotein LpoB